MNDAQKSEHIQTLVSLGLGKSEKEIRDLLEYHNWNPDAAAEALFESDAGPSASTSASSVLMRPVTGIGNFSNTGNGWDENGLNREGHAWDEDTTMSDWQSQARNGNFQSNVNNNDIWPAIDTGFPPQLSQYSAERGRSLERTAHTNNMRDRDREHLRGALNSNGSSSFTLREANFDVPHTSRATTPDRPKPVIDLTGDEDYDVNVQATLQASLDGSKFGPSDRAPSVHWAMVPSNKAIEDTAIDMDMDTENDISRALSASLQDAYIQQEEADVWDEPPPLEQIRRDNRPLALRTPISAECWGPLLIQALYYVPQVRLRVAAFRLPENEFVIQENKQASITYMLHQFFALLSKGQMSSLSIPRESFPFEGAKPAWDVVNSPGFLVEDLTERYYEDLALSLENVLSRKSGELGVMRAYEHWTVDSSTRLFHFQQHSSRGTKHDRAVVRLSYPPTPLIADGNGRAAPRDLLSLLTAAHLDADTTRTLISVDAHVVGIVLRQSSSTTEDKDKERTPFEYPITLYLDRFLDSNEDRVRDIIRLQKQIKNEIQKLEEERNVLTQFEGSDVLTSLRESLTYLENVGVGVGEEMRLPGEEMYDEAKRMERAKDAGMELRSIISSIEGELDDIKRQVENYRREQEERWEDDELKKHRYDLRAVLYSDGLFGRQHVYSYVKDYETGLWWKTVDYVVTPVTEDAVLSDNNGLHFGGGPYLLLYSRYEESFPPAEFPKQTLREIFLENSSFRERLPVDSEERKVLEEQDAREEEELSRRPATPPPQDLDTIQADDAHMSIEPSA